MVEVVDRVAVGRSICRGPDAITDGVVGVTVAVGSDLRGGKFAAAVVEVSADDGNRIDRVRRTRKQIEVSRVPVDRFRAEAAVPVRDEIGARRAAREGAGERPAVRQRVGDAIFFPSHWLPFPVKIIITRKMDTTNAKTRRMMLNFFGTLLFL